MQRDFHVDGLDRLWVADITYAPTGAGFLYLAVVLDAWSRRVIGWAMQTHLRTDLALAALDMALAQRRPDGVIRHSDHGSQYKSLTAEVCTVFDALGRELCEFNQSPDPAVQAFLAECRAEIDREQARRKGGAL